MGRFLFVFLFTFIPALVHGEWKITASEQLRDEPSHFKKTVHKDRDAIIHIVLFDSKKTTLRVIDQPSENGGNLASAVKNTNALAGINASYFHPDRKPLGLVIMDGKEFYPLQKAKLLSGLVTVTSDKISLLRTAEYKPGRHIKQAVQAGPYLIDRGKEVHGLNNTKRAARSVIISDGKSLFGFVAGYSVTLAEMAQILATPGLAGELKIDRALNLDGGTSTALWVRGEKPFYFQETKTVRNYLAAVPREKNIR